MFSQLDGFVSASVALDRETGVSRGFGFIRFETWEQVGWGLRHIPLPPAHAHLHALCPV